MMTTTYLASLPIAYRAPAALAVRTVKHHDAVTCLDHAVFCARHGFYRQACRYALRSLVRPVW